MKKRILLIIFVLAISFNSHSQTKSKINFPAFLINKAWYIDFSAYQMNGVGQSYKKNRSQNLFILKSNNDYSIKLLTANRSGRYAIKGNYLLLFNDNVIDQSDNNFDYDKDNCAVFEIKPISTTTLELSSIAGNSECRLPQKLTIQK